MGLRDADPVNPAGSAEVGGYRIEDRLGSGSMGVVLLARSASSRRLAVRGQGRARAVRRRVLVPFRRKFAATREVSGACTAPAA